MGFWYLTQDPPNQGNEIAIMKQDGQLDVEAFSRMTDGATGSNQPGLSRHPCLKKSSVI
jgi:hypothetical protein